MDFHFYHPQVLFFSYRTSKDNFLLLLITRVCRTITLPCNLGYIQALTWPRSTDSLDHQIWTKQGLTFRVCPRCRHLEFQLMRRTCGTKTTSTDLRLLEVDHRVTKPCCLAERDWTPQRKDSYLKNNKHHDVNII